MKRPLALVLTIAIFAAIAVCFLRPAPPDFGYGDEVYIACQFFKPNAYNKVRITGDSECFSDIIFGTHLTFPLMDRTVWLDFDEGSLLAGWEDMDIEQDIPPEFAVLETRSGGGWNRIDDAVHGGIMTTVSSGTVTSRSFSFILNYPSEYQPGDYRFTVFFREAKSGEQHSVSINFSVPRKTSARWDVADVFWTPANEIHLTLRANRGDGVFPYIDCESVTLEKLESGEYLPLEIHPKYAEERYVSMIPSGNIAMKPLIVYEDPAVGAEYRL